MQSAIRGVLIDVSGTVHVADQAIPGASKALDKLRASGIPFRFCTNTTQTSGETLANKLQGLGFNVNREEIFTSLSACKQLVQSRKLRPLLFLEPDALKDFEGIPQSEPHDSVVIGLSPSNFHYDMMNKAFRILVHSDRAGNKPATLIAVHKAKYFADKDNGNLSMGPGGFVEALEYASGIKAHVVGKPQRAFFELAIQNMGLSTPTSTPPTPSSSSSSSLSSLHTDIAMIGDDVEQDLGGGAAELGFIRYLVKTGKYRKGDEDGIHLSGGTFEDFAAVVDNILERNKIK
ncbi:Haloacid dehalogenase-like hydrolase domain-containing protein 2 [Podila humilis]|nr:Haloacid dehalogenase-like hydrolase domain-containing protein 2 [Podila humilis]